MSGYPSPSWGTINSSTRTSSYKYTYLCRYSYAYACLYLILILMQCVHHCSAFHHPASLPFSVMRNVNINGNININVGSASGDSQSKAPHTSTSSSRDTKGAAHLHLHSHHSLTGLKMSRSDIDSNSMNSGNNSNRNYSGSVKKRQTAIFDGAEFISIASVLKLESEQQQQQRQEEQEQQEIIMANGKEEDNDNDDWAWDGDVFDAGVSSKRAGYMTFLTAELDSGDRVLGIQMDANENADTLVEIDDNVCIQKDSIVNIPKGISDSDAISTAVAALAGVRCSFPTKLALLSDEDQDEHEHEHVIDDNGTRSTNGEGKSNTKTKTKATDVEEGGKARVVVLGGSEYACFVANAMDSLGADVSLVTTRPMSLKDTPLNPLRDSNVNAIPPAVGDDELGFSEALGTFDAVVDTLGDEARLEKVQDFDDGIDRVFGYAGVSEKLKKENRCQRYISTRTQSQRIVLKEGILFARGPVLQYQKEIESSLDIDSEAQAKRDGDDDDDDDADYDSAEFIKLPAPSNYGQMLQKLFDANIIFPTDRNENGSHQNKKVFVRGCSFPDYAEFEMWPADSTDGASVRYGFPGIADLTLEAKVEKMMGSGAAGSGTSTRRRRKKKTKPKKKNKEQSNPFVMEVESLRDLREEVVDPEKDAILFVTAPYCKLCRQMTPNYTRMGRIFKEEKESDVLFLKASTAGKEGKQLTFTFGIDSVPTFILFKGGKKYGDPFGVVKLPSKKLDSVIECLEADEEFPYDKIGMESKVRRTKLK